MPSRSDLSTAGPQSMAEVWIASGTNRRGGESPCAAARGIEPPPGGIYLDQEIDGWPAAKSLRCAATGDFDNRLDQHPGQTQFFGWFLGQQPHRLRACKAGVRQELVGHD